MNNTLNRPGVAVKFPGHTRFAEGTPAAAKTKQRVQIWQLKDTAPPLLLYEAYERIAGYGLSFLKENYRQVYEYDHDDTPLKMLLDEVYARFNFAHPDDFRGHSLSVSDVVVVGGRAFYVDRIGFREVPWS